jgi:heterodisulfide reductase subunit B
VRHLLDILINDVGLDRIRAAVVKPLKGLRVACYYGCQVPRPDYDHRFNNHEYPTQLEAIMKACGANVIDFPMKTHCCGGHMTQISESAAYGMIRRLIAGAEHYEADIMVMLCPMCQLNLDAYQVEMNHFFKTDYFMPAVYFTQLMGIAFGKEPAALGFGKEFVSARDALAKIGVEAPVGEDQVPPPTRKAARPEGLPMPAMPERKPFAGEV